MRKILIVVIVILIVLAALLFLRARRPLPPPPTPSPTPTPTLPSPTPTPTPTPAPAPPTTPPGFLFMDTYEESPTNTKLTHGLWDKIVEDTKNGNYWIDDTILLENGKIDEAGRYKLDPMLGEATVTSEIAHAGTRSAEIRISEVPSGHVLGGSWLARWIRNPNGLDEGVYEVGAWFCVPKGYTTIAGISMENRLSDFPDNFYIANVNVNPEDGSITSVIGTKEEYSRTLGKVDFHYDTWFKLWIVYDTREKEYTVGYKSPTEEKTFEVDRLWLGFQTVGRGFNLYAGGTNLPDRSEQKLYVDDFYAKFIGKS